MLFKLIIFLCSLSYCLTKKLHPLGARVTGDILLLNDTLYSPTYSETPENHFIEFEYPLHDHAISYIELTIDVTTQADFILSVVEKTDSEQIFKGSVLANYVHGFYLKISVFGFNKDDIPKGFKSLIEPNINLSGQMEPEENHDYDNNDDYYEEDENYLVIGNRQPGDEPLYENVQYSDMTDIRTNHTVKFYYVDKNFVTYAKFTPFHTSTANAVYSQVSEHTLKAEIYDTNAFGLDVRLEIFGYKPENVPIDYYPPLPSVNTIITPNKILDDDDRFYDNTDKLPEHDEVLLQRTPEPTITTIHSSTIVPQSSKSELKIIQIHLYNIIIGFILIAFL